MRPMWPWSTYKHYPILVYDTVRNNLILLRFVIFGLTTNTDEIYQSVNKSTKYACPPLKNMATSAQQCKKI